MKTTLLGFALVAGNRCLVRGRSLFSRSLSLSAEHESLRETCRQFAVKELAPVAADLDRDGFYPKKQIEKLSAMGLMSMCRSDGLANGTLSLAVVVEELSRECASTGAIVSIHNCLFANLINRRGTVAQKDKYLALGADDASPGCFCLSEPDAGSNVAEITTAARKCDDNVWVINGTKAWVSSAPQGKAFIVFAKTDSSKGRRGITAFIVDKDKPGIIIGKKDDLIGVRALSSCTVTFDNVKVDSDDIIGEIGEGFRIAMSQLDQARIGIAAQSLGIAGAALKCALSYSIQRKALNKPIAQLPTVQTRLANMVTNLEASRLLTWKAAIEYDSMATSTKYSSMAKLSASECANFCADNCVQILGGMGLIKGFPAERHYRDARVTKIYGGVTDVQKMVIGQQAIKEYLNTV